MEIDTNLYGGFVSANHFWKLNNWFYCGFAQKFDLCVIKITWSETST